MKNRIIEIIDQQINSELENCFTWYGDLIHRIFGHQNKVKSIKEMENALENIDTEGEQDQIIYSAGFLAGLKSLKLVLIDEFKKDEKGN